MWKPRSGTRKRGMALSHSTAAIDLSDSHRCNRRNNLSWLSSLFVHFPERVDLRLDSVEPLDHTSLPRITPIPIRKPARGTTEPLPFPLRREFRRTMAADGFG